MSDAFIEDLIAAGVFPSQAPVEHIETHISHVLLTDDLAYKIKKPVNLGFVDFSSLQRRKFYCEEELRLNRRLAPELYLAVATINRQGSRYALDAPGQVIEYVLVMARFDRQQELHRLMGSSSVTREMMQRFAHHLADFHARAQRAGEQDEFGECETVRAETLDNFRVIRKLGAGVQMSTRLDEIESWSKQALGNLEALMHSRKQAGMVRECHGDLHLRNLVVIKGRITAFDCLEFNPDFRWIDVCSEIAFFLMDLVEHHRRDLARVFLNAYLDHAGDFVMLRLLRFYLVYRAMVRAKVAMFAARDGVDGEQSEQECLNYLTYAHAVIHEQRNPVLVITCGLSGSGKTYITDFLLSLVDVVRVRSDLVRKRLFEIAPMDRSAMGDDEGVYSVQSSEQVYRLLTAHAEDVIEAGYPVIVDATFIQARHRQAMRNLAKRLDVPFRIVHFEAGTDVLRQRITQRLDANADASDADLRVLEKQLASFEPLTTTEAQHVVNVTSDSEWDQSRASKLCVELGLIQQLRK